MNQSNYVKEFQQNTIIFCEHEPGNTFYLIKKGKVKISKISEKYEKTLDILSEGSIFGEMSIIEQAPRSATAIAETDVTVMEFTKENFKEILTSHPELLVNLVRILSYRTFEAKRRLSVLMIKDNEGKVIDALLMIAENMMRKNQEISDERPIAIASTIADIGHWCGLNEQATKVIVFNLEKAGKVELKPGFITIKNFQDLKRTIERKKKMAKAGLE